MQRELSSLIERDLGRKIVLLTGPRQSGKTWISRHFDRETEYLSYDHPEHREIIRSRSWNRKTELVVLDELHKMPQWTTFLKGIYDTESSSPPLLVTGSARLGIHRKTGESLAGRFFHYRLHPFDVRELAGHMEPREVLTRICTTGGFPEPFLADDPAFHRRWRRSHLDVILRQDLLDVATVSDIRSIELLVEIMRHRVGSPVSWASIARDLHRDPKTVKRWCEILEDVYVIFPVHPWHRKVERSVLKEPKYYFFDTGQLPDQGGVRLENAVACSLLKALQFAEDNDGIPRSLHYLRTRDGKELDFCVVQDGTVTHIFEVKQSDTSLASAFSWYRSRFPEAHLVQLVADADRIRTWPTGEELHPAADYLAGFAATGS